jgi:hypothetical protein
MTDDDRKAMEWASKRITELTAENGRLRRELELATVSVVKMGPMTPEQRAELEAMTTARWHPLTVEPPRSLATALPVIPETCGECEHCKPCDLCQATCGARKCALGNVRLGRGVARYTPPSFCPLRLKSEEP